MNPQNENPIQTPIDPNSNPTPSSSPQVIQPTAVVPPTVTPPTAPQEIINPVIPPIPAPTPVQPQAVPIPAQQPQQVQQQTPPPPAPTTPGVLQVDALRGFEQGQESNSLWQTIMQDPEMKKKFIIGAVMVFTVILALIGIIFIIQVFSKASAKSRAMKQAAAQSMYEAFAAQNNLRLLADTDPLLQTEHPGLLDQYNRAMAPLFQNTPGALSGMLPIKETAVSGTLANGTTFSLQNHRFDVRIDYGDSVLLDSGFSVNGVSINSLQSFRSIGNSFNGSIVFQVSKTIDESSGTKVNLTGHYSFLMCSLIMPGKLMPHTIIRPTKAGFTLPFNFTGFTDLTVEGNFNELFTVSVPDGYQIEVLQLLEPNILAQFIDIASDITIEMVGDRINLYLAHQPFAQPASLADDIAKIHSIAGRLEPWFIHEMSTFRFTPQQRPFDIALQDGTIVIDEYIVADHVRRTDKKYVSWSESRTGNDTSSSSSSF